MKCIEMNMNNETKKMNRIETEQNYKKDKENKIKTK